MSICFVNGEFVHRDQAKVSVFDRGFLFADGVYEVSLVLNGKLVDNRGHLQRLMRSLAAIHLPIAYDIEEIIALQQALIARNQLKNGGIYLQITRGDDGDRDFMFSENCTPSIILTPIFSDPLNNPQAEKGISVMSIAENRWAYRHIKTIGLLGAVLAKHQAKAEGYDDAWFIENDVVNEGTSNNAYIIKNNMIITKPTGTKILGGITRQSIIEIADQRGLAMIERDFSLTEAYDADEAFATSATMLVMPVIAIDGKPIANGKPGETTLALRQRYIDNALASTDT